MGSPEVRSFQSGLPNGFQATLALVMGVVFVILAGLVFATTAWTVLPSFCKLLLAAAFSGIFFAASWIGRKVLHIGRTSKALYLLGSIFLFVSVLVVGYFELLGSWFSLAGSGWLVLWIGSLFTGAALWLGNRWFSGGAYRRLCLASLAVSSVLMISALNLRGVMAAGGMICFGTIQLLILRRWGGELENRFARFYIMAAGGLMMLGTLPGVCCGLDGGRSFTDFEIQIWTVGAMMLLTAQAASLALERENGAYRIFFSLTAVFLAVHAAFALPLEHGYESVAVAVLASALLLWGSRKGFLKKELCSTAGDAVYTASAGSGTVLLYLIWWCEGIGSAFWDCFAVPVSLSWLTVASVLLFAAVVGSWARRYPAAVQAAAAVLFFLNHPVLELVRYAGISGMGYEKVVFLYLLFIILLGFIIKKELTPVIAVTGAGAQLLFLPGGNRNLPFLLVLAVYLACRSGGKENAERWRYQKAACLCFLTGLPIVLSERLGSLNSLVLLAAAWMAVTLAVRFLQKEEIWNHRKYFLIATGNVISLFVLAVFYQAWDPAVWYAVFCTLCFAVFYVMAYRENTGFFHLFPVLLFMRMPAVLVLHYGVSEQTLYLLVSLAFLATGAAARSQAPVIEYGEDGKIWRIDWYHVLAPVLLIPMILEGSPVWRFLLILLLAAYALQYVPVKPMERWAKTAALFLLCTAWWEQPFFRWPELIETEAQLLAVAVFAALLTPVWGNGKGVRNIRTILYCLCLAVLSLDGIIQEDAVNALILEFICLLSFFGAGKRRSKKWMRITGGLALFIAVYMTRAFWLSISWWIYLLLAGIGLILFAAGKEMKKGY